MELPNHKLKADVSTQWNSAYAMLTRYLEMQSTVTVMLRAKELGNSREKDVGSLNDEEYATCIANCLQSLKDVTTMICTEATPTASIVMPLFHRLMHKLLLPECDDSNTVIEMKDVMATKPGAESTSTNVCIFPNWQGVCLLCIPATSVPSECFPRRRTSLHKADPG